MFVSFVPHRIDCCCFEKNLSTSGPVSFLLGTSTAAEHLVQYYSWDTSSQVEPEPLCWSEIHGEAIYISFRTHDSNSFICVDTEGFVYEYNIIFSENGHRLELSSDPSDIFGSSHAEDTILSASFCMTSHVLAMGTYKGVYWLNMESFGNFPVFYPINTACLLSTNVTCSGDVVCGSLDGVLTDVLSSSSLSLHAPIMAITSSPNNPSIIVCGLRSGKVVVIERREDQRKVVLTKRSFLNVTESCIVDLLFVNNNLVISTSNGDTLLVDSRVIDNLMDLEDEGMVAKISNSSLGVVGISLNGVENSLLVTSEASSIEIVLLD
ncbi:hypothetical protein P9112_007436 [Eukaryota sp. TZLM1-RC]